MRRNDDRCTRLRSLWIYEYVLVVDRMQFIPGIKQAEQSGESTARLDPAHHILAVSSSSRDILSVVDSSGRDDASNEVDTCIVHCSVASLVASSSISFATEDDGGGGSATPRCRRRFPICFLAQILGNVLL